MLRKAKVVEREILFLVGEILAEELKMSGRSNLFLTKVIEANRSDAASNELKDVGERRKSRHQDFCASAAGVGEPLDSSWVRRFGVRGSLATFCGNRACSMGLKETEGRLSSSRITFTVKAP